MFVNALCFGVNRFKRGVILIGFGVSTYRKNFISRNKTSITNTSVNEGRNTFLKQFGDTISGHHSKERLNGLCAQVIQIFFGSCRSFVFDVKRNRIAVSFFVGCQYIKWLFVFRNFVEFTLLWILNGWNG